MATTSRAWDGSPGRWDTAAAYCRAALIDQNPPGEDKVKANCKLPIREPGGDINTHAVSAAAAALVGGRGGVDASLTERVAAARRLVRIYRRDLDADPPPRLVELAGD